MFGRPRVRFRCLEPSCSVSMLAFLRRLSSAPRRTIAWGEVARTIRLRYVGPVSRRGRLSLVLLLPAAAASAGALRAEPPKDHRVPPAKARILQGTSPARLTAHSRKIHHYEYVFPERGMFVYDIDHGHRLVQVVRFPQAAAIRGVAMSARLHLL